MWLEALRINHVRSLSEVTVRLTPGITVFVGPNGAGKTSLLEGIFLLSHARSFRHGVKDALLQRGMETLSVFAQLRYADEQSRRLGLGRQNSRWEARRDGVAITLGELVGACAVVCFEPGSHALIAGGAEERRRYLDWGVFHVEHEFITMWRRYQRALKQRNALLKSQNLTLDETLFQPWEAELATMASHIDQQRTCYLAALRPHLVRHMQNFLPELGAVELRYRRGWAEDAELADLLSSQREKDQARGHTSQGSHRADWALSFTQAPLREHLSRGQEKLVALACVLAQASLYAERQGDWPIVCLDDLASELDQAHQAAVIEQLNTVGAQVLITGTEVPQALRHKPVKVFHVEQGKLHLLL